MFVIENKCDWSPWSPCPHRNCWAKQGISAPLIPQWFPRFVAKSIKQNKLFFQTFYLPSHQNQSLRIRSELCFVFQTHQLAGVGTRQETHKARPGRHQRQGTGSLDLILSRPYSSQTDDLALSTFNCRHKSFKRFSMGPSLYYQSMLTNISLP